MRFLVRCIGLGTPKELDDIILDLGEGVTRSNVVQRILETQEFAPYANTLQNGVPLVKPKDDITDETLCEGDYIVVMHRILGIEGG